VRHVYVRNHDPLLALDDRSLMEAINSSNALQKPLLKHSNRPPFAGPGRIIDNRQSLPLSKTRRLLGNDCVLSMWIRKNL
jgi:hypothetical protein